MNDKQPTFRIARIPLQWIRRVSRARSLSLTLGLMGMITTIAIALSCGWDYSLYHSVRFNHYNHPRKFYRLPPLPDLVDPKTGRWKSTYDNWEGFEEKVAAPRQTTDFWQQANEAEDQGDLAKTQSLLQSFLKAATTNEVEYWQEQVNSAQDRLDAMTALQQGATMNAVRDYLALRCEFDEAVMPSPEVKKATEASTQMEAPAQVQEQALADALERLNHVRPHRSLQDNYAYLQAAMLYRSGKLEEAKVAFQAVVARYPRSEKREAALYMVSAVAMKISRHNVTGVCSSEIGNDEASRIERRATCQDENWKAALTAINQVLREYPRGRFVYTSLENRAYWYRRGGELAAAVTDYYRILGHPSDVQFRLRGKEALRLMGEDFGTDEILHQIETDLADEPQAALAYAYHRIYNHAVDSTYEVAYHSRYSRDYEAEQKEDERVRESHDKGHRELQRIATFAATMMQRYPKAGLSGRFVLRVAQAQFELQNFHVAWQLANKALSLQINDDLRAEALWIKGSAEHQRKDLKAARATFTQLVTEFPNLHLTEGARRLLAMTAEDQGDLEEALKQYLMLNYVYDIAYFVDVLMPIERLAKFIERYRQHEKSDELRYALGVRLMREKQWDEARAVLRQIKTVEGYHDGSSLSASERDHSRYLKEGDFPGECNYIRQKGVQTNWVLRDLKTIDDLERMEQAIATMQSDEAKAEAMYQLASYLFDGSTLLFYNPSAWQGQRRWLLYSFGEESFRQPDEARLRLEHSTAHEPVARSIPIYEEIVRRFPNTKAAQFALFSIVVAHERLADYNDYWRGIYNRGLFVGAQKIRTRDVLRAYPKFRLPITTMGWEASTRTINGGPAWEPLPKPAPPPTRTQKAKRWLKRFLMAFQNTVQPKVEAIENRYNQLLQRCVDAILWALGLIGVWYGGVLGLHFWKQRLALEEPDLTGLFAADVPPDSLPNSESRVEKVIGNDR